MQEEQFNSSNCVIMYILSVEGVTILPVETAEEIAEWLLKTPLILGV